MHYLGNSQTSTVCFCTHSVLTQHHYNIYCEHVPLLSWSSSIIHQYSLHGSWYDPLHSSNIIIHCSCLTCRSSWLTLSSLLGIPHLCQYLFLELWLFNRCLSLAFLSWVKLFSKTCHVFFRERLEQFPSRSSPSTGSLQVSLALLYIFHVSSGPKPSHDDPIVHPQQGDFRARPRAWDLHPQGGDTKYGYNFRRDYNRISQNHSKIYIAVNIWTLDIQN